MTKVIHVHMSNKTNDSKDPKCAAEIAEAKRTLAAISSLLGDAVRMDKLSYNELRNANKGLWQARAELS